MNKGQTTPSSAPHRMLALGRCFAFAAALALVGASPAAAEKHDVGRFVVVGDSLSAGFQNYSLMSTQQVNGYASLLARQAGVELILPEISYPGIPQVLEIQGYAGSLPIVGRVQAPFGSRTNPMVQVTNLSVPAAKVQDALEARPNGVFEGDLDGLVEVILGVPGLYADPPVARTQIEWAEALRPDTLVVWIGNNDVLLPAWLTGSDQGITSSMAFAHAYTELLMRAAATGASVITANIPDITTVAAFVPDSEVEKMLAVPPGTLAALGVPAGSRIKIDALPVLLATPQGVPPQLTADMILDPAEIANIRQAIGTYNNIIEAAGSVLGVPVVDVNGLVQRIVEKGYKAGKKTLNTSYLGGLYSLDGVHPTNTGYAVIANEFIHTMNTRLKTRIARVDVEQVAETDPLVP